MLPFVMQLNSSVYLRMILNKSKSTFKFSLFLIKVPPLKQFYSLPELSASSDFFMNAKFFCYPSDLLKYHLLSLFK